MVKLRGGQLAVNTRVLPFSEHIDYNTYKTDDIQQLNQWAYEKRYPVTKVSTYCLGKITKDYVLLSSGAAISHTGPKLIAK